MQTRLSLVITAVVLAGCPGADPYKCQSNAQCVDENGAAGICEASSYCSFADAACTGTSRRYPDGAGDGKAGACVAAPAASCIGELAAGDTHFCLIRTDGTVWCWGGNDSGQLGDGTKEDRAQPVQARTPAGKTFVEVRLSENHTCALASDGTVWCWGGNDVGQLGVVNASGTPAADTTMPLQVQLATGASAPFTLTPFLAKDLSAGGKHVCAVGQDAALYCWGENSHGQCGQQPPNAGGTVDDVLSPTVVPGLTEGVVEVDVGDEASACLKDDGSVYEFGGNANGQLGNATTTDSYQPVAAKISSVVSVTSGDEHVCAAKGDGSIWCWGYGAVVGLPGGADQSTPQRILSAKSTWAGGSAFHTCAIQNDTLLCWGQNDEGQIGIGTIDPNNPTILTPTPAFITTVTRAAASTNGTCAVTAEGQLWCWGANDRGQLGQGAVGESSTVPLRVSLACP